MFDPTRPARPSVIASGFVIGLFALLTGACASAERIRVAGVLDEVQRNELAALEKYRDKRLEVTGIIVSTGVIRQDRMEGNTSLLWWGGTTLTTRTDQVPYAHLVETEGARSSHLFCFFDVRDLQKASKLTQGASATLTGDLQEFSRGPGGRGVVLAGCEIK